MGVRGGFGESMNTLQPPRQSPVNMNCDGPWPHSMNTDPPSSRNLATPWSGLRQRIISNKNSWQECELAMVRAIMG